MKMNRAERRRLQFGLAAERVTESVQSDGAPQRTSLSETATASTTHPSGLNRAQRRRLAAEQSNADSKTQARGIRDHIVDKKDVNTLCASAPCDRGAPHHLTTFIRGHHLRGIGDVYRFISLHVASTVSEEQASRLDATHQAPCNTEGGVSPMVSRGDHAGNRSIIRSSACVKVEKSRRPYYLVDWEYYTHQRDYHSHPSKKDQSAGNDGSSLSTSSNIHHSEDIKLYHAVLQLDGKIFTCTKRATGQPKDGADESTCVDDVEVTETIMNVNKSRSVESDAPHSAAVTVKPSSVSVLEYLAKQPTAPHTLDAHNTHIYRQQNSSIVIEQGHVQEEGLPVAGLHRRKNEKRSRDEAVEEEAITHTQATDDFLNNILA